MSRTAASPSLAQPTAQVLAAWQALVDAVPDPAWVVAVPSLQVVAVNAAAVGLLGTSDEAARETRADHLLATPEDLAYWDDVAAGSKPEPLLTETVLQGDAGQTLHLRRSIRPLCAPGEAHTSFCLVTALDTTETYRLQAEQEDIEAELTATLESTADGILVTDLGGRVRNFNRRFATLWSIPEELMARGADDALLNWMRRMVTDPQGYQRRLDALHEASVLSSTERLTLVSGQTLERIARPLWSRGRSLGRVWSFRDLSERLAADQRVEDLARTDDLTGLPNRRYLAEQVEQTALGLRHDGDGFALLVLDLDRFRRVNESLGHDSGDRALREVAERLSRILRAGDMVARIGGDQFALLLRHVDAAAAERAAYRVLASVSEPWQLDGITFTQTCSVGIALAPGHGRDADELLSHAESAMRNAKQAGSNGMRFHQQRANGDLRAQMRLDHAMRQALASHRFRLNYQPQVDMATGRVISAEALIRWRDPVMGEISPMRFIPVAEETGFIISIGDWVLANAASQAAQWYREGREITVAVNVSALQFQQSHFVDRVADVLKKSSLPPHCLELELTESILVRDADEALQRLQALAALGVRLSIDDFGTGYSSLSYLKRFPIYSVKIDRSFVKGLPADGSDAGIVRAIVEMARALKLRVIAEGVETVPQREFLNSVHCHAYQGFLFSAAMDAMSFGQLLATQAMSGPEHP
jgi:diguanylate cyclase (GGDEF)-like protein